MRRAFLLLVAALLLAGAGAVRADEPGYVRGRDGSFLFYDGAGERIAEVTPDGAVYVAHVDADAAASAATHDLAWAVARIIRCLDGPVPGSCRGDPKPTEDRR